MRKVIDGLAHSDSANALSRLNERNFHTKV